MNGVKQSGKTLDYHNEEEGDWIASSPRDDGGERFNREIREIREKGRKERWIATLTLAMTFKGNALLRQYNPPRTRLREPCTWRGDPDILTFVITIIYRLL